MSTDMLSLIMAEMVSKGLFPPLDIIPDGRVHRFNSGGRKNGWYICFVYVTKSGKQFAYVIFGNWKDGSKYKFKTDGDYSNVDILEINHFVIRKNAEAEKQRIKEQKKAQHEAKSGWNVAEAVKSHPYLTVKQISNSLGARVLQSELILPLVNTFEEIQGLQKIDNDGNKLYIFGQSNKGNFVVLPVGQNLRSVKEVIVCEGYATGASIRLATNKVVICALNAGNLLPVCWALKQLNPAMKITIAGDDDRKNQKNTGREKAIQAAMEVGADLVFPKFRDGDEKLSDFNDIHVKYGISEVAAQLTQLEEIEHIAPAAVILAEQFLKINEMSYVAKNRLVSWRKEFLKFCGTHYKKLIESDLYNDVFSFLQKHPIVWNKANPNLVRNVMGNIEAKVNVKSDTSIPFWISSPELPVSDIITLKNGVIDLFDVKNISDIKLLPHSSDLLQITCLDFSFNPDAKCPVFFKFLNEMLPDKLTQMALAEWFGYNLVFDTKFEKFAIFYGAGANGKSVSCLVLKTLLGSQNVSAVPLEAFDPKRTFPLAATFGKLANIVGEISSGLRTEEGVLKNFVTGETMTAERKGKDPFEFTPTARATFATNVLPKFSDSTDGLWRKLLLFPFKVQILDPKKQNKKLSDPKFWVESGEIEGVFNWALEGLLRLRANGAFTISSEMSEMLAEYKLESNPTREFLLDSCEVVNGAEISATMLYGKYETHMRDNGYVPLAEGRFANEVRLAFPTVTKSKHAKQINVSVRSRIWFNLRRKDGAGGVI